MATIHAHLIADQTLFPRSEFERLVELAQRSEPVEVLMQEEGDTPTLAMMHLAEKSGSFDFWQEEGEDIYNAEDGEPV